MFDPENNIWKNLPPMNEPRRYFNPCFFNEHIYLCGWSSTIEAFSPTTNTFSPFKIPFDEVNMCCLYVYKGSLMVRSCEYLACFAGKLRGDLEPCGMHPVEWMNVIQSSQPVVYRGLVYMVNVHSTRFAENSGVRYWSIEHRSKKENVEESVE